MIQLDTKQTRSLADLLKPVNTLLCRGAAAFQARLFVSLLTTVSVILFHTLFSDGL